MSITNLSLGVDIPAKWHLNPEDKVKDGECIEKILIPKQTFIGTNVTIGEGTELLKHIMVFNDVVIGKNCMVFSQSVIGASSYLGNNVEISNRVTISGNVFIGNDSRIISRFIGDDSTIGNNVQVSLGATVLDDVILGDDYIVPSGVIVQNGAVLGSSEFMRQASSNVKEEADRLKDILRKEIRQRK